MDNSKAYNSEDIQSSLFPLEPSDTFEARIEELSNTKPYKPQIFANTIHYAGKSNFTPVATPLKNDKFYGLESVVKNHFGHIVSKEDLPMHIGTPTYELLLKDKAAEAIGAKPIFDSTVKANNKDGVKSSSPDSNKGFDIGISDNKQGDNGNAQPLAKSKVNNTPELLVNGLAHPVLPITKVGCNCKNSLCLKLYCECFRNQTMCKNCSCINCFNKTSNTARRNAINTIKAKNPAAFDPKFKTTKMAAQDGSGDNRDNKMAIIVSRGCKCKNSNCRKKYCECYQYGLSCSGKCNCVGCENGKAENMEAGAINGDYGGDGTLSKRNEFDVREELKKKLLEIKKFKVGGYLS